MYAPRGQSPSYNCNNVPKIYSSQVYFINFVDHINSFVCSLSYLSIANDKIVLDAVHRNSNFMRAQLNFSLIQSLEVLWFGLINFNFLVYSKQI